MTVVEAAPTAAATADQAAAALAAVPNLVQAVTHTQQTTYVFNPERFSEVIGDFWFMSTVTPVQTKRLWQAARMELAGHNSTCVDSSSRSISHFVFDKVSAVWRKKSLTAHAFLRVRVELDRQIYVNRTRTKEMCQTIQAW